MTRWTVLGLTVATGFTGLVYEVDVAEISGHAARQPQRSHRRRARPLPRRPGPGLRAVRAPDAALGGPGRSRRTTAAAALQLRPGGSGHRPVRGGLSRGCSRRCRSSPSPSPHGAGGAGFVLDVGLSALLLLPTDDPDGAPPSRCSPRPWRAVSTTPRASMPSSMPSTPWAPSPAPWPPASC